MSDPAITIGGASYWLQSQPRPWSYMAKDVRRYEVRQGDKWPGDATPGASRTEACGQSRVPLTQTWSVSYDMLIETGLPQKDDIHCLIGQFHHDLSVGPPPLYLCLDAEHLTVVSGGFANGQNTFATLWRDPNPVVRGVWHSLLWVAKFDLVSGLAQLSIDGSQVLNYSGPLAVMGQTSTYWKEGIYRYDPNVNPLAVNYANLVVSTS